MAQRLTADQIDFELRIVEFKREVSPFAIDRSLIRDDNADWQRVKRIMEDLKWHKYVHKFSQYTTVVGRGKKERWIKENTQEAVDILNSGDVPQENTRYFIMGVKTARQAEQSLMNWIYR